MQVLLLMFSSSTGRTGTIQEDALMTVGTLVEGKIILISLAILDVI